MSKKVALITGITGQDGSYLAEFLIDKGYEVHGIKRKSSSLNTDRIDHLIKIYGRKGNSKVNVHYGDLTDYSNILNLVNEIKPDEVYNLAAQSHVAVSFEMPEYTADVDALGTLRLLEAIKTCGLQNKTKFYQASTSELYGLIQETPQTESTPFHPRSPYAVAKLYSFWITKNYRESYNMFTCNGILFNHESERRGETFVTRKITRALTRIKFGLQEKLILGNIDALRDWGYAKDYVEAMWKMLQLDKPVDLVISTGHQISVRTFIEKVCKELKFEIKWNGSDVNEKGYINDKVVVEIDSKYFRPAEVENLIGDSSKAKKILGWKPQISIDELVSIMVKNDLKLAQNELLIKKNK